MPPTACIILPYFGSLPEWFPLFLATCERNPTIRWLIYTDDPTPHHLPPNVGVERRSFKDYTGFAGNRLGIDLSAMPAYKLTDLKPFLGEIHAEELQGARYWGFGDMDVLYGNLERFLEGPVRRGANVITTHDRRVAGHFCLLRNTETFRRKCFAVSGWQMELERPDHVSYDEFQFSTELFALQRTFGRWYAFKWYRFVRSLGLDAALDRSFYAREAYTTPLSNVRWHDGSQFWEHPLEWEWTDGRLISVRDGVEVPYLHFMNYKSSKWLSASIRLAVAEGYVAHPPPGCRFDEAPWAHLPRIVQAKGPPSASPRRMTLGLAGITVE
ncbi:MAG: hypothetical protein HOP28_02885 [Gemmatimonadales bacterium]|nr:hypothetical protein [Gemmatimonadales bacterium]